MELVKLKFENIIIKVKLDFFYKENFYDDFYYEFLFLYWYLKFGLVLVVGDVNGD